MKRIGLVLALALLALGCQKDVLPGDTHLIQGQTFTQDLRIQGHEYDSLLIEDCDFIGGGINLGDADYVIIRNCRFEGIKGNGIKVGFIGPAEHVEIEGCNFRDIGYNAIDSHEDAPFGIIRSCTFEDVALSDIGAAMGQPHHAIYWKAKDVLIEDNIFRGGQQKFGNGISVRSSGVIRRNRITGFPKNGIMYFADHPGMGFLQIENNFIADNNFGITLASANVPEWHNLNVTIRYNSIFQEGNRAIYIAAPFESTTTVEVVGNLIYHPDGLYFKTFYEVTGIGKNLSTRENPGFTDAASGDLHLNAGSPAIGYMAGETQFPATDIEGDARISATLNAGADE